MVMQPEETKFCPVCGTLLYVVYYSNYYDNFDGHAGDADAMEKNLGIGQLSVKHNSLKRLIDD